MVQLFGGYEKNIPKLLQDSYQDRALFLEKQAISDILLYKVGPHFILLFFLYKII